MEIINDVLNTWNDIATRYSAARRTLAASKKENGKKSAETKAARKVVRAIKKERAAFMTANTGFVAPPKPSRKKTQGMQYTPPAPKEDRTTGETVGVFRAGKWFKPDGVTPDEKMNAELNAAAGPWAGVDGAAVTEAVQAVSVAAEAANAACAAPVAAEPVKAAAKGLTAILLETLAAGNVGTPSQLAALIAVPAGLMGLVITPKQVADALGRLAKTGKATKTDGKYAAVVA